MKHATDNKTLTIVKQNKQTKKFGARKKNTCEFAKKYS